jgi:hypothetical protein
MVMSNHVFETFSRILEDDQRAPLFTDKIYQGQNPNKTRGGVRRAKQDTAGSKKMKYNGKAIFGFAKNRTVIHQNMALKREKGCEEKASVYDCGR